ncbi:MAG: NADH-quinone oxidoreductase subunit N [Planctomycetota bacterium]|jgi:NADH-quinone oxidoreductase subunit N
MDTALETINLGSLFSHFMAETILILAIPVILFVDLRVGKQKRDEWAAKIGLLALCAAFFLALIQDTTSAGVAAVFVGDTMAKIFRVIAIATGMVAAVATLRADGPTRGRSEFFVLLLGAVAGACFTAAANDLAVLYLAVETLSICGYLLAGIKKDDPDGSEAAMKYVIFGAVSSGFMLFGLSLLYGFAGTAQIAPVPGVDAPSLQQVAVTASGSPAFLIAILMVMAGLAYKIAAAPFQFWCPDVYQGSPTAVAAFLAVASKGAGFVAVIRIVSAVTWGDAVISDSLLANNDVFRMLLALMAVVTITVGNVAALRQQNSKRLLAYSAIAHAGYLLLGVAVASDAGASAVVTYMIIYGFMTIGAFYLVGLVERYTGRTDIDAFEGLGYKSPALAVCMFIFLVSLTGLPPTAGFVGKFFIFKEVFAHSAATGSDLFFWCGVIGLLNAPIGLYYYMRFAKVMYLCDRDRVPQDSRISFAGLDLLLVGAMLIPVLVLGLWFGDLLAFAEDATMGVLSR